ncbi:MAG: hypothetical protein ACRDSZ_05790 [Pseudonocardiaceae bacterium]
MKTVAPWTDTLNPAYNSGEIFKNTQKCLRVSFRKGVPMGYQDSEYRLAAASLANHPQDHGWRELYRFLATSLEYGRTPLLTRLFLEHQQNDAQGSPTHAVTLVGIALKTCLSPQAFASLLEPIDMSAKIGRLEMLIRESFDELERILVTRRNSFTGARRFLIPQVLLSAFFRQHREVPCVVADLGTGLGIMPRQLNSEQSFELFAPYLHWPQGIPVFRSFDLAKRFGIDRPPLPTGDWVGNCYGVSNYYRVLYKELCDALAILDVQTVDVTYTAIDIVEDSASLERFLRTHGVNAVSLSYVFYQVSTEARMSVLRTIQSSLVPPFIAVIVEPRGGMLGQQGCTVTVYTHEAPEPVHFCSVSDGHFIGDVSAGTDYMTFTKRYPIDFS